MKSKRIYKSFVVIALTLLVACNNNGPKLLLPVYGEKKVVNRDTVYHKVSEFELTNQFGEKVTQQTVRNKIYIANFFFATCQSICPVMSTNLTDVQKSIEKDDSLLILSHTVNPMHDTVEVLKNYGITYGAIKNKWHLLTGSKKVIYDLAKSSYLVNALEDDGSAEGFLHSEMFLLIDTQGRLRGIYDGTDKAEVLKMLNDIKILKSEKYL